MTPCELGPTERAYQKLREDIVLQSFGLGGRLMINELADRYAVSATPVREALSRLYGEGLIGFEHGKGYHCKTPSLQELQHLYDVLRVVLIAGLKDCQSLGACPGDEDGDIVDYAELVLSNLSEESPQDQSLAIARLTERIVALCGNKLSYTLVRNINARTFFILRHASLNAAVAQELQNFFDMLTDAIRTHDRKSQKLAVNAFHTTMRTQLPNLLGDYVREQYLAAPR